MPNTQLIRVGAVATAAALAASAAVLIVTLAVYPGFPIGVAVEGVALIVLLFAMSEFWTSLTCLRWRRAVGRVVAADNGLAGGEGVIYEAISRLRRPVTVGVEYEVDGRRYSQMLLDYAEYGAQSGSGRYQVGAECRSSTTRATRSAAGCSSPRPTRASPTLPSARWCLASP